MLGRGAASAAGAGSGEVAAPGARLGPSAGGAGQRPSDGHRRRAGVSRVCTGL